MLFPGVLIIRVECPWARQLLSEEWIPISELEGECWENRLETALALEILRVEEASPELSPREARLGEFLGDS